MSRRLRHPGSAGRAGAQVAAGRRPLVRADPVLDAGDDSPVRRGATRRGRRGRPRSVPRTPATSPGAKPTSWRCGTVPGSDAYDWFTVELANLRTAFRWAADHDDLDVAATIATYAGFLGYLVESYEPIAWAEELIEPARADDHPRLAFSVCDGVGVLHGRTHRGGSHHRRFRARSPHRS